MIDAGRGRQLYTISPFSSFGIVLIFCVEIEKLTLDARELREIINDDFAGVDVIIDEGYSGLWSVTSDDGYSSKAQSCRP